MTFVLSRHAKGFAVALLLLPGVAAAADAAPSWHPWGRYTFAIGAGMSHYSEYRSAHDDGSLSNVRVEENDDRFQGSIGFAGRYLGIEVGYETLGRVRLDGISDGTGALYFPGRISARIEGHGLGVSGLLRAPAGDRWVTQVRLGLLGWNTTERTSESGGLIQAKVDRSGTSLVVGAGGELRIDPAGQFWARAEVTRTEVGEKDLAYLVVTGSFVLHY